MHIIKYLNLGQNDLGWKNHDSCETSNTNSQIK